MLSFEKRKRSNCSCERCVAS
ncbi:hypothetical protein ABWE99_10645 [Pasteurella multocida]